MARDPGFYIGQPRIPALVPQARILRRAWGETLPFSVSQAVFPGCELICGWKMPSTLIVETAEIPVLDSPP